MAMTTVETRTLTSDLIDAAMAFGIENGISGMLAAEDYIFWYIYDNLAVDDRIRAATEYLESGKHVARFLSALLAETQLREVLEQRSSPAEPVSILEFASGYGRVTRHFPKELPQAEVVACDIHQAAIDFIKSMGLQAIQSAHDPDAFDAGRKFDVIFVLSFFTHMPRTTWKLWLDALGRQLKPNGLLIFTTHGEVSQVMMGVTELEPDGFFFHTASEQKDLEPSEYGNTVTAFEYVFSQIRHSGLKLLQFKQAGAGHHDLYVLHRKLNGVHYLDALEKETVDNAHAATAEATRLEAELDAMYRSTSWKLTGPLRALARTIRK